MMNKITILSNKEFETKFGDYGYSNCMYYYEGAGTLACRIIEAYKMWKKGCSLDDILYNAWCICFDECYDDEDEDCLYIPQGVYDFYKETIDSFEDNFCDDKE